jgi:hypothetical protein
MVLAVSWGWVVTGVTWCTMYGVGNKPYEGPVSWSLIGMDRSSGRSGLQLQALLNKRLASDEGLENSQIQENEDWDWGIDHPADIQIP